MKQNSYSFEFKKEVVMAYLNEEVSMAELVNQQFYTFARNGTVELAKEALDDLLKPINQVPNENIITFDSLKKKRKPA